MNAAAARFKQELLGQEAVDWSVLSSAGSLRQVVCLSADPDRLQT